MAWYFFFIILPLFILYYAKRRDCISLSWIIVFSYILQTYDPVEDCIKFYDKFFCRKIREEELVTKGNFQLNYLGTW